MLRRLSTTIALCAALTVATGAGGQSRRGVPARAPVLVVMVDSLASEPGYRITRLAHSSEQDVILLPRNADPAQFSEALETLRVVWAHDDGRAGAPATFRLRPGPAEARRRVAIPWAERVIADLRAAPEREVPGVGRARSVRIWLARLPAAAALH